MTNSIPEYNSKFDFSLFKNLYLVQKPADLRKGIDGYCSIISSIHSLDPADGSLYLFTNKSKNKVKGIFYDGTGYWLIYKRLNSSSLKWPLSNETEDVLVLNSTQLESLLGGLSIVPSQAFLPFHPRFS